MKLKPLDIVVTKKGSYAVVRETDGSEASIEFMNRNTKGEKSAWYTPHELELINSIPNIISNMMAHPFGSNKNQGDIFFPTEND